MTTQEFFNKYLNKSIDFDGQFGAQCFDVYRQYCKEVLEVPQSPATGSLGAKVIWQNYLREYFEAIPNSPLNHPELGDIVIWGEGIGKYGHVAICKEGGVMSFTSFDQNWNNYQKCVFVKHSFKGVLGWLRRRKVQVLDTLPEEITEKPVEIEPVTSPEPPTSVVDEKPILLPSQIDNSKPNIFQVVIRWLVSLLGR